MIVVIKYLLLYLIIISGNIFVSYKFHKKTCQTISPTIMLIMGIMYIFGLAGLLKEGVYITSFLCIVAGSYTIIKSYCGRTIKSDIKSWIDTGFVFFSILFLIFAFTTYNKLFTAADDYNYWSIACKNMYYLDDFITNDNAIIRTVYPPYPTIIQYFSEKIIGQNRQGIELFISMMLGFSLMLPFLKNIKGKKIIESICILGIIIAIPAIFIDSWFYGMIYVDTLLGLLIGYTLFEYYTSKKDKFLIFSISLSLMTMSLIKPTGFFIACFTVLIFICDFIIYTIRHNKNRKEIIKQVFDFKKIKIFIIFILICVCTFMSWEIYKTYFTNAPATFVSAEKDYEGSAVTYFFKTLYISIVGGETGNADVSSNVNIFTHIFDTTIYSKVPIELTAGTWLIMFMAIGIIIYEKVFKDYNKEKFGVFMISIYIGTFIYICFYQAVYVIRFPNFEAVAHASIERYIGTYLVAILFVIVGILINYLNEKEINNKSIYILLLGLILIFTPIQPIANLTIVSGGANMAIKEDILYMINMTKDIKELVDQDEKIYAIDQKSNENENITKFKYYIYPLEIDYAERYDNNDNMEAISNQIQKLENQLYNDYNYVIILDTNEYFNEHFNSLFLDDKVYSYALYKVEKDYENKTVKLSPIYINETKSY